MYRIVKSQNFTYSMIQCCLNDHSLIGLLDKSKSNQLILWIQTRFVRLYSHGKKGQQQSCEEDIDGRTEKNQYSNMMQFLSVGSKDEEKNIAELKKLTILKEKARLEVKATGVPAVIRAMVPSMFLNKSHSYSGVLYYPTPLEWYCEIKQPIETSAAYNRLCFKLNVPYYLIRGFCSRQALLKLCEVTKPGESMYSFYKNEQAVNEMFEVVTEYMNEIKEEELMKLIHYRYTLKDFSGMCYKKVLSKFLVSMNEDRYRMNEILDFLQLLKNVDTSIFIGSQIVEFEKVIRKIWDYISQRPDSIPLTSLRHLYFIAPRNHEKIFPVLNKVLIDNLDVLEICDVFLVSKEIQLRTDSTEEEAIVCEWLESRLDAITITDLENILPSFLDSQYISPLLFKILPQIMISRTLMKDISTNLLSQILLYCTLGRHQDKVILEMACNHYIDDKQGYDSEQLHSLLQSIGTLNFVPIRQRKFFTKVELHLMENFYNIDVLTLLEMIVYLVYINKVAVNFRSYIFAPLFLGLVNEMRIEEQTKATRCLRILEKAFTARGFKPKLTLPRTEDLVWSSSDKSTGLQAVILDVFKKILGDRSHVQEKPRPTGSGSYFEIQYNVLAEKAGMKGCFHNNDRLAFLVMTEDSFCKNKKDHMLGEEMTNIRLLQEDGLTVVWVHRDKLDELDKDGKLDSFVKSLFLQILETADDNLSPRGRENMDVDSGGESEDELM